MPQHRTQLGLSVCLFVCTGSARFLPSGICTGLKPRCRSCYFRRGQKVSRKNRPLRVDRPIFWDTYFSNFLDFVHFWGTWLGSSQRGPTALRVQSSIPCDLHAYVDEQTLLNCAGQGAMFFLEPYCVSQVMGLTIHDSCDVRKPTYQLCWTN